ncbi:hypothetical protein AMTRI_Chr02g223080 [Amborella trichopoda]|uniref:pentatricopeptide repeat-containing protein At1g08070, chloroplastic-like n=1 Tax=Amborella trichopoda TaxID=13333 RepID=UPI0009C06F9C|nr:pentatricopeptide repeat-containing protein At1g08070, chloroplastic-like [Amborella trichopoda]|eukprot:XP_011621976.2 pentatricopeptide repeat-containing protein At1g08070, chloroplastic-like [Amborella trichopoda]
MPPSPPPPLSTKLCQTISLLRHPNPPHFLSLLNSSKTIKSLKQIHAQMIITQAAQNTFLSTKLLESCVTKHQLGYASLIFSHINDPNAYAWTTMIRGFVLSKSPEKAIEFFTRMKAQGVNPNNFSLLFMLKAFTMVLAYKEGRLIHGLILKLGLELDLFLHNALVHMYSLFGDMKSAHQVFGEMPMNTIATYNALISGCFSCGDVMGARKIFDEMIDRNVVTWNAMVSGYSKLGLLKEARFIFEEMPIRDVFSWSAMISGYSQSGRAIEALALFQKMQLSNIGPDSVTMVSVLSACATAGALDVGKWVHAYIDKNELRCDVFLGTSLVDMYAKCGCIDMALRVFREMPHKNVFTWNAMISGLSLHGHGEDALSLFAAMEKAHVIPNEVSFVGVLCACTHVGRVEEGCKHFNRMIQELNISPKIEHYGCMVDLLGRSGRLEEAREFIKSMPMAPNIVIWGALLGACKIHGDVEMGESVVKPLVELRPRDGGCYVLLSNIYAAAGRWSEAAKLRKLMREMGVERVPGCSSIEVNSVVHEFLVEDRLHPQWKEVYEVVNWVNMHLEDEGYVPDTSQVLYDIDDEG